MQTIYSPLYLCSYGFAVNAIPFVGAFLNQNIAEEVSKQDFKVYSLAGKTGASLLAITALYSSFDIVGAFWTIGNIANFLSLNHSAYRNHEINHYQFDTSFIGLDSLNNNYEY